MWYVAAMDDDTIIHERIAGRFVRAIAKAQGRSVAQVNQAIDRWARSQNRRQASQAHPRS
jgi:hypothetical protein